MISDTKFVATVPEVMEVEVAVYVARVVVTPLIITLIEIVSPITVAPGTVIVKVVMYLVWLFICKGASVESVSPVIYSLVIAVGSLI